MYLPLQYWYTIIHFRGTGPRGPPIGPGPQTPLQGDKGGANSFHFLLQHMSVAVQRGNTGPVLGSLKEGTQDYGL